MIYNNMMQKNLLLLIVILLSLSFVSSQIIFKSGDPIDLKVACENNGTLCSSSAACNLTVIFNNGSIILKDGEMTNQGSFFNYTVGFSEVGTYRNTMNCLDQGLGGVSNFNYEITMTGDTKNWMIFTFLSLITLVALMFAFYSGNEYIMFSAAALLILTGIYGAIYGIGNAYNVYTLGVGLTLTSLGIFFFIISSLKAIAEISNEKDPIGGFGKGGNDEYDYFNS